MIADVSACVQYSVAVRNSWLSHPANATSLGDCPRGQFVQAMIIKDGTGNCNLPKGSDLPPTELTRFGLGR
jgi:hypothetical protein